jgi:CheY-like chemotaxis protein
MKKMLSGTNYWLSCFFDQIMDGISATREIRRLEAELGRARMPIIAVTAHGADNFKEQCDQAGMQVSTRRLHICMCNLFTVK